MKTLGIGWDIHRKFSMVSVRAREGDGEIETVERARLEHADKAAMRDWLERWPKGTPVAIEAAFGWPWIADLVEELGLDPRLAHPPAVKVLTKNEPKSDRRDADRLARLQLQGILPGSYLAPPNVRQLRERTRYRAALVQIRAQVKCRVQAALHRCGVLHEYGDLFGVQGRRFLQHVALPAATRAAVDGHLKLLDMLQALLDEVETWMVENLSADAVTRRLTTIPGIGLVLAHVIQAEAGDLPQRFAHHKKFASYAGLAPLSDDSAGPDGRHGRRHISPRCNHTLRWALLEAANVIARHGQLDPRLSQLYARLSRRGRASEAKVAVARELAKLVFVVWTKGEDYRATPAARPGQAARAPRRRSTTVRSGEPR